MASGHLSLYLADGVTQRPWVLARMELFASLEDANGAFKSQTGGGDSATIS
jgi:hypothetical protein